jgi:hypothetical protein
MFKKETNIGSIKQIAHTYSKYISNLSIYVYHIIYSIVVSILYVVYVICALYAYRAVCKYVMCVYSRVCYIVSSICRRSKERVKRGEGARDYNRHEPHPSVNHFLHLYYIDAQHSTTDTAKHTLYTHICHIIYIMLNSVCDGCWVVEYFTQAIHRCIDTTHVYNSMTIGHRSTCNPVILRVTSQSYSTDLESARGCGRPLSTHQNLFSKILFREPFSIPIHLHRFFFLFTNIRDYFISSISTIRSIFYLNTRTLFLYRCIRINPKKFYKKLFEKTNFTYSIIVYA